MSNDVKPDAQHLRAQDAISGGTLAVEEAFIVVDGDGDYVFSATGPAGAYWELSGGDIQISATATAHDAYFKQVGTYFTVK